MDWKLICWIISVFIFWGYATWYVSKWGIPKSWSDTFYNLNKFYNSRNRGYIFTGVLWGLSFPLLPVIIEENPLMFASIVAICFVGAAPAFKDGKLEERVHEVSALVSVFLSILIIGFNYELWYLMIILAVILSLIYFKWKISNKTMWVESIVILTTQLVILFKNVLTI